MVQPLAELPANLVKRAIQVQQGVNTLVKGVAQVIGRELIVNSPVDTGETRSNWIASLNGPSNAVIPPYAPYPKYSRGLGQGAGESANATAALSQHLRVIVRYDSARDTDISIANNSPNVGPLNQGFWPTSQTAPGWVKRAVEVGKRSVRRVRLLK